MGVARPATTAETLGSLARGFRGDFAGEQVSGHAKIASVDASRNRARHCLLEQATAGLDPKRLSGQGVVPNPDQHKENFPKAGFS